MYICTLIWSRNEVWCTKTTVLSFGPSRYFMTSCRYVTWYVPKVTLHVISDKRLISLHPHHNQSDQSISALLILSKWSKNPKLVQKHPCRHVTGSALGGDGSSFRIDFGYFSCLKPETFVRYLLEVQKLISCYWRYRYGEKTWVAKELAGRGPTWWTGSVGRFPKPIDTKAKHRMWNVAQPFHSLS